MSRDPNPNVGSEARFDAGLEADHGQVRTEVEDQLLLIAIDRPAHRNAFTPRMLQQLAQAFTRLEDDPTLHAGVLHGIGGHFTSGFDHAALQTLLQRGEPLFATGLVDPAEQGSSNWRSRSKPVIAAVTGEVGEWGMALMLAADVAIAADDCRFQCSFHGSFLPSQTTQNEARPDVLVAGSSVQCIIRSTVRRVAQRAGQAHALAYLLAGSHLNSEEALQRNLVHKVVRNSHVLDTALRMAYATARQPQHAVAAIRAEALRAWRTDGAARLK